MEGPHLTWFVPVRNSHKDTLSPTIARLPDGTRVGIAYTSLVALEAASGSAQPWIRLGEHALKSMLRPLGIDVVQVDPALVIADARTPAQVHAISA